MRLFVAVTDNDWFELLSAKPQVDEVNFWRPSATVNFKALQLGEVLLFKLHAADNFIAGGGFFTRFVQLPLTLAWDTFGKDNGVPNLEEWRARLSRYRRSPIGPFENPTLGCVMLAEPFFWPRDLWIPCPEDFKVNTVQGKG